MTTTQAALLLPQEKQPVEKKLNNNIREIRTIRQLDKANLDFDSPRMM